MVGWRVTDSCLLTWDKIDDKRRVIAHYIGKTGKHWEYPMDPELAEFLKNLPHDHGDYVFEYRDYHALDHIFRDIVDVKDTTIRNHKALHVHTLRKQFTYNCFRREVPLELCSKLLGHTSIKTTEKYYTYWGTQHLRDALEKSREPLAQIGHSEHLTIVNKVV